MHTFRMEMETVKLKIRASLLLAFLLSACSAGEESLEVITVNGPIVPDPNALWLSHEHILVDFAGADSIHPDRWDTDSVVAAMLPYLEEVREWQVKYFVDATPNFLARDVGVLKQLSEITGIEIITNTGLYGAAQDKYIPAYAHTVTPESLAESWISEFEGGIDGTKVRPGFIKISVDTGNPLDAVDEKLVHAAAITHLETGLTIGSHTGEASALWPQLEILQQHGVSPEAFIWIHAQNEPDPGNYVRAAQLNCWISLDGLGWEQEDHLEKLVYAREQGILDHILISHDAGWYDPSRPVQDIKPYTPVFEWLVPRLRERGFSSPDIDLLLKANPRKAFGVRVRKLPGR